MIYDLAFRDSDNRIILLLKDQIKLSRMVKGHGDTLLTRIVHFILLFMKIAMIRSYYSEFITIKEISTTIFC